MSAAMWLAYARTVDPSGRSLEAIEEHDLADRQVSNPPLDVLAIPVAGLAKGDNRRLPWAHALADPFDEAVRTGAISPFNGDHSYLLQSPSSAASRARLQRGRTGPRVYVD
jgi:hypothetical protein